MYIYTLISLNKGNSMHPNKKVFLQVISSNPGDSSVIQDVGADRIQLVSALQIGGVTPSSTIVRKSLQAASIPTHVIVRHHNNGFVCTQNEKKLLLDEIVQLRDRFKVHGVVVGAIQQNNGRYCVDRQFVKDVMQQCEGRTKVTFHKASDYTNLPETIKTLSELKVDQVLTQGGKDTALSAGNIQAIRQIDRSNQKTQILIGGGINKSNVNQIIHQWGIKRVHIGTCVREDKYGPVSSKSLQQFIQILEKVE